jgi:hypothetical protein
VYTMIIIVGDCLATKVLIYRQLAKGVWVIIRYVIMMRGVMVQQNS